MISTFTEEIINGKLHFCAMTMKEWGDCQQKLLQLVQWNKYTSLQQQGYNYFLEINTVLFTFSPINN